MTSLELHSARQLLSKVLVMRKPVAVVSVTSCSALSFATSSDRAGIYAPVDLLARFDNDEMQPKLLLTRCRAFLWP